MLHYAGLRDAILTHPTMAEGRNAHRSQLPQSSAHLHLPSAAEQDWIDSAPLDNCRFAAYTSNMSAEHHNLASVPCLCGALRQASRAVSRLYDEELRGVGLRTTQYSLLQLLRRSGEVRQRDLADLTMHEETTLTRNLRPLVDAKWVAVRTGEDRREKWLKITAVCVNAQGCAARVGVSGRLALKIDRIPRGPLTSADLLHIHLI